MTKNLYLVPSKAAIKNYGFSDHTPWKYHTDIYPTSGCFPKSYRDMWKVSVRCKRNIKIKISIKIGLECEYFPEYIHWLKGIIKEYKLDYIIFGNHHFHTDEKFPYFGRNTDSVDMLELYEESAIEGMESGLFAYLAIRIYLCVLTPEFDRHCKLVSRHICRTAVRLNLPLEYNIGYEEYNDIHGITTILIRILENSRP